MDRSFWQYWAHSLQRFHLRDLSLALLDGAGPLKVVLSQLMFAGIPFAAAKSKAQWEAAATMLEDGNESRTFAEYLRKEPVE